ncbi:MAG: hypothetical protein IKK26_02915 [Clostridia bacterium]|nr:hypothetical protein [Clostridia bacterium]
MRSGSLVYALPAHLPAFVCDKNGNIVFLNELAENAFENSLLGKNITDFMSLKGKLQYEIAMKSKNLCPFSDTFRYPCGYSFLCIAPGIISFCRLATVVLFRNETECEAFSPEISPLSAEMLVEIISNLISTDRYTSDESDEALFDAQKAISRIKDHLNNASILPNRTSFSYNYAPAEGHDYICGCPLYGFTSMLVSLAYVADSLSASGKASIDLHHYENTIEIKIKTETSVSSSSEEYSDVFSLSPLGRISSDVCRFIAESNQCKLNTQCYNNIAVFTLTLNYPESPIDFKSNDPFKNFDDMLDRIINSIASIYREEAQG